MTTTQAYIDFKKKLKTIYDEREAENITDWIFEDVTGLKKWEIRSNQAETGYHTSEQLKKYLQELLQHKPVQYVLKEAWFYKRKFYVNENVLIPRPETEELVEWVISDIQKEQKSQLKPKVIDIGTGSGCIPVSLKKELPKIIVTAIDESEQALQVAKKNARDLRADITFLRTNFLNENEWDRLGHHDIIVSNPPYIPIKEKEALKRNVTDFEPPIALFVPDNNAFIFYEKIAKFAKSHLHEKGKIFVEVHEEYADKVKSIFEKTGFTSTIKKDFYGKERMVRAIKSVS